jgi:hypothetical protein
VNTFTAPWSRLLIGLSVVSTVVCVGAGILAMTVGRGAPPQLMVPLLLALIFGTALFTVRGYAITPDAILVRRLFWNTCLPLAGLESATFSPGATKGSIRVFGNGGMYAVTGWFRNRELGSYRAFVTDFSKLVVLRYPGKTIVLSPGEPEEFIRELMGSTNRE